MKFIKTYPDNARIPMGTYKIFSDKYVREHNRKVVKDFIINAFYAIASLGMFYLVILFLGVLAEKS